jgi:hypothetical protein
MSQLGRISGGVLQDNLLRQGVNLNFKNTTSDTALLHLDVNNSRIGINTEAPGDTLSIPTTYRTVNLLADYVNTGNYSIQNSEIVNNIGNIFLTSADYIFATSIATANLKFDFNTISSTTSNSNIEIRPNGTGTLNMHSNWNITGSLHATGDITFGGNLTLGNNDADNVSFAADVNSDLIPDQDNTSNLGSPSKQWLGIYSTLLNGQSIQLEELISSGTSVARRQGNIFYVSTLGSDTNVGDHQHGAFRTLKHALAQSDGSTEGPIVIHIFPGVYEEDFPLTVPPHVTVSGEDLRNTVITPTSVTETQDAFLVQGDVTIENITVKDFYYNSVTNTGHAFRFTPNGLVSTRSPYIRNVSVITQGSVTSAADPRGFNNADAGRGAYIDGSELDADSLEASMLFHSATFITPGVDCITMTNGVRVEWLNSFTYFANRGLYALEGSIGKPLSDSSLRYGAEIRSIGSANVYGNFGAVANGPNTLMYLIGHNFAYIGTGKDVTNDGTLVEQANETVEINFGKIYYNSTDAFGTYRIGDQFFVDFETGTTSINAENIDFSGVSSIIVNTNGSITYIDGERIDTGNLRITGNTIINIAEDLEISPYTEILTLTSNPGLIVSRGTNIERTNVSSNVRYNTQTNLYEGYSTANLSFGGIYSDNRATSVDATNFSNEIIFRTSSAERGRLTPYSLEIHGLSNENILFDNNIIRTTLSNSDLELIRSGNAVVNTFDIDINDSYFSNISNSAFVIATTDRGYAKFDSTTGLVIPYGTTAERSGSPEIGDTRWNLDLLYLETWNGTEWQPSTGEDESVTEETFKELMDIYTLVLG